MLNFPHHHDYAELTAYLQGAVERFPDLAELRSIGRSHQGRDIWVMTLTNRATGPHRDKPAYWIDANIHAGEITGGATALYTIETLLTDYGKEGEDGELATWLLDHVAVYVAPRISPDGVEAFLKTPDQVRSSVRPYPFAEEQPGLQLRDIDGDGRVLQMRVPDPKGPWVASEKDPRLLRRRQPHDRSAQAYQLYPEGDINDFDGFTVRAAPPRQGLDLNRNFPHNWAPEGVQRGAGPFPTSEPETRAVAQFFAEHSNINGVQSYHTYSGVLLRPFSGRPDSEMPTHDLRVYQAIGERGTTLTGYPHTAVHSGFRYHPKETLHGGFFDWLYGDLGIFAYANELWDVVVEAGIGKEEGGILRRDFMEWLRDHPEEDDLKLLRFNDRHDLGGFEAWRPFEHPQLGPVEIGGWDYRRFWGVAPLKFLEAIAEKHTRFTLEHAAMAPRLGWGRRELVSLGGGLYGVKAVLENQGFLPTDTSQQARERKAVPPIRVTVTGEVVSGLAVQDTGPLEGRSAVQGGFSPTFAEQERLFSWVLRGGAGDEVTLTARSTRAGVARLTLTLPGEETA